MTTDEYNEREEERNIGFSNGFPSWYTTFFLITGDLLDLLSRGESSELKHTMNHQGIYGIKDIAKDLTDRFEDEFKDEEWMDKDYVVTLEDYVSERYLD